MRPRAMEQGMLTDEQSGKQIQIRQIGGEYRPRELTGTPFPAPAGSKINSRASQ